MAIKVAETGITRATTTRTLDYPFPPHLGGDLLMLVVICQTTGATSDGILTPPGVDPLGAPSWVLVGGAAGLTAASRAEVYLRRVAANEIIPSETLERPPAEAAGAGTVLFAQAFTLRGVDVPAVLFSTSTLTAANAYSYTYPAGIAFTVQCNFAGRYANPAMNPAGTIVGDWGTSIGVGASMTLEYTEISSAGPSTFSSGAAAAGGTVRFIIVLDPLPEPPPLILIPAQRGLLRLGCAEDYEVFITRNDTVTMEPEIVDAVGWSKLDWDRVLDDISTASVVVPDHLGGVRCCASLGGLVPWRFGLRIERDGQKVWDGPVVTVKREGGASISITANDQLARFRKRFASLTSLQYTNLDAGEIFEAITAGTALRGPFNGWVFRIPSVRVGLSVTREVVARDFELAYDLINELFESALDGYVLAGDLVLFEPGTGWIYHDGGNPHTLLSGPYNDAGELVYGLFTGDAWTELPNWSMSGWNQANSVYVAGADSGEHGFRRIWTAEDPAQVQLDGPLEMLDQRTLHKTGDNSEPIIADSVFQQRAVSLVQLRAIVPAVIEGASLTQDAPVSMEHLRPGSIWLLDVHDACYGQLLGISRVKSVKVSVGVAAGVSEEVSVVLTPPGHSEADLG